MLDRFTQSPIPFPGATWHNPTGACLKGGGVVPDQISLYDSVELRDMGGPFDSVCRGLIAGAARRAPCLLVTTDHRVHRLIIEGAPDPQDVKRAVLEAGERFGYAMTSLL
jgi:hypothetical protein